MSRDTSAHQTNLTLVLSATCFKRAATEAQVVFIHREARSETQPFIHSLITEHLLILASTHGRDTGIYAFKGMYPITKVLFFYTEFSL